MSAPCDGCCRVHRGPRCSTDEARSKPMCITLPAHVDRWLREHLDWGEKSRWVTEAIEQRIQTQEDV